MAKGRFIVMACAAAVAAAATLSVLSIPRSNANDNPAVVALAPAIVPTPATQTNLYFAVPDESDLRNQVERMLKADDAYADRSVAKVRSVLGAADRTASLAHDSGPVRLAALPIDPRDQLIARP